MRRNGCGCALLTIAAVLVLSLPGCGAKQSWRESSRPTASSPGTAPRAGEATVKVCFMSGDQPVLVESTVSGTADTASALGVLLAGPSMKDGGLSTAIPAGTRLLSYRVGGGTANVDLSKEVLEIGGGSAAVQAITEQVTRTVLANERGVERVEITVEGVPAEESLQP